MHFGRWCREAAAGDPSARDVYPAKLPLREAVPELAAHLESRDDTPLDRYGACVFCGPRCEHRSACEYYAYTETDGRSSPPSRPACETGERAAAATAAPAR